MNRYYVYRGNPVDGCVTATWDGPEGSVAITSQGGPGDRYETNHLSHAVAVALLMGGIFDGGYLVGHYPAIAAGLDSREPGDDREVAEAVENDAQALIWGGKNRDGAWKSWKAGPLGAEYESIAVLLGSLPQGNAHIISCVKVTDDARAVCDGADPGRVIPQKFWARLDRDTVQLWEDIGAYIKSL